MKWPKILALVLLCASFIWFSSCSRKNSTQNQQSSSSHGNGRGGASGAARPIPVGVAAVQSKDVPVILTGLGTITPYYTVTVHSRIDGQLMRVNFREGQFVKKGDLLAVIDPRPFEVALQQAEGALARDQALLRTSQVNLQRAEALTKEGVMATQQLNAQQAETGQYTGTIELDKAAVENAKVNLSYTQIRSPIDGRVGLRLVDPGNIVHASDQNGMLVITQMQPIAVLFTLPEEQIPEVVARMKTGTLPVQAYDSNDQTLLATGKLETIDNTIDPATGTVRLKGIFDNRDSVLWPNQFVNVHLQIQTLHNATVLPASAVQHGQQNSTFVYLVDGSNKVQMRNVELKLTQGDIAVVANGINPGDRVVVDGQDRLQAGMTVEPVAPQNRQQNASGTQPGTNNGMSPGPTPGQGLRNGSSMVTPTGGPVANPQQQANGTAIQGTAAPSTGHAIGGKSTGHGRRGGGD